MTKEKLGDENNGEGENGNDPLKAIDRLEEQIQVKEQIILDQQELIHKLKQDLIHDPLTGLKTKTYFEGIAENDLKGVASPENEKRTEYKGYKNISYLFCDIDNFKSINDTYGHQVGDEILKEVAGILSGNVRNIDTVCRWGGEEIIISLMGVDESGAVEKAEKLRKLVEKESRATISTGVSSFKEGISFEKLIKQADEAMYLAKRGGKNCVRTYTNVLEKDKEK